jgi:ectoine hydroxylase-related dioxygenase (phytanoyl-CoA dioxygenase family)
MTGWEPILHTDGVARLGRLLDTDELDTLRAAWSELVDDLSIRSGMGRTRWLAQILQVESPHAFHPVFARLAALPALHAIARKALGTGHPRLLLYHLVWRAPQQSIALPWHQDHLTWPATEGPIEPVAIWVALDPADAHAGALRYAPGSHLLTASLPVEPHPVHFAVDAGEALIHTARTWHASGPNRTNRWRRAAIFVFAAQ